MPSYVQAAEDVCMSSVQLLCAVVSLLLRKGLLFKCNKTQWLYDGSRGD